MDTPDQYRVLRVKDVLRMVGFSKSSLYDKININSPRYDPSFPRRVKLGVMTVGWFEHEIIAWLNGKREIGSTT